MCNPAAKLAVRGLLLANAPALFARLYRFEWYGGTLRRWVDQLELPDGASILEIGCGLGKLTHDLAKRGYRVTGVDRSPSMIRRARRKVNSPEGVRFECADAFATRNALGPFQSAAIDIWVARAPKLDCKAARQLFGAAGLGAGNPVYFLDRMLASIVGRRK